MEQMAAGPPVMASTFQAVEESRGCERSASSLWRRLNRIPHFHGHFFGRTSYEAKRLEKAEHTHTSNETGILLL